MATPVGRITTLLVASCCLVGATFATAAIAQSLPPSQARAAVQCQAAIKKAASGFVETKLKSLDQCATSVLDCIQTKPLGHACRGTMVRRCAARFARIAGAEARLAQRIFDGCGPVPVADLMSVEGLGYAALAPQCQVEFATTLTQLADIARCVVRQHECRVEELFDAQEPRARELIQLMGVPVGADSCLIDRGGLGGTVGDGAVGKKIARCQQAITKAATRFAGRHLRRLQTCADEVFDCVQLAPGDDACLERASRDCDGQFAGLAEDEIAFSRSIHNKCTPAQVAFAALLAANGLDLGALTGVCATYGIGPLNVLHDYKQCLTRQHECLAEELLQHEAPRAVELFARVGRTLPSDFCPLPAPLPTGTPTFTPAPTVTPSATPSPTSTPTPTVTVTSTPTPTATATPGFLGLAESFAILANTTVTNTGPTVVSGNLGLNPGTSVTGFPPGVVVNGAIFIGTPVASTMAAVQNAYDDLAARTLDRTILPSGEIGALTLTPGLYQATTSLSIGAGNLTLDALGDPNAIFVFQIGTTLITGSNTMVLLINGANANNIYWQVGSSATLGVASTFQGTILAHTSITATTGVQVTGRLLAINGAVTLDTNTVTVPAP